MTADVSLPQGMSDIGAVIGELRRLQAVTDQCSVGTMRCSELRSAMHELRGFLDRMQDPSAEEEEDSWENQRFR